MNDTETRLLAQHMGHKFNIHVEHYALQTQLLERGKVAKILCAIQNGKLSRPNEKKPTHEIALEAKDVIFTSMFDLHYLLICCLLLNIAR